ncbi:tetratricopeptide repeat protein [Staphylospora marina]|uniref:tetratricopeptide repeat protein n=1 Tax=Staphylospora marina TaxID=2490858 RepID=UPI000F5BF0F9|nr:tetratricopeptide repeat protein [Staphylospora marina]
MNPTIDEWLRKAETLPDGDQKIELLEKAVRLADMEGDEKAAFAARLELTGAANFAGRADKALVSFAWCLARFDKNPELCSPYTLMWQYKWIANDLDEFPQLSLEKIRETLEDLRNRYRQLGMGERVYAMIRHRIALRRGDMEEAAEWFERWLDEPRDDLSDCLACELDTHVTFLLKQDRLDEALRLARPLLNGDHTCKHVPANTWGQFLIPLAKAGRWETAEEFHRQGLAAIGAEQGFLSTVSDHVLYLTVTDRKRARELFSGRFSEAMACREQGVCFHFLLAGLLLAERSEAAGEDVNLPEPATKEWLQEQVMQLADAFDRRNGNDHFRGNIDRHRRLLSELEKEWDSFRREREATEQEPESASVGEEWGDLVARAESGDATAMFSLGLGMLAGDIPGEQDEGNEWIRRAAEAGHLDARLFEVHRLVEEGENPQEGLALLRENVASGHGPSITVLGWYLISGGPVEPDPVEGVRLLRQAAELEEVPAMFHLARCLLAGLGCHPDPAEAERWLLRAADKGDGQAMDTLAHLYLSGVYGPEKAAEGETWLRRAAEAGLLSAMHSLGSYLMNGTLGKECPEEGEQWLRRAAEADYPPALHELGNRLLEGKGLRRLPLEGEVLLRRAAVLGNAEAMLELGGRLLYADGMKRDLEDGFHWLSRAVSEEQPTAMFILGTHLVDGDWIEQDVEEGLTLIRRAAERGEQNAIRWLKAREENAGQDPDPAG